MATYAIGDVQGCLEPLLRLLEKIDFNPLKDRLWFTGDLVARGPQSLEVLRFVRDLGDIAIVVLGNHDLHLLAESEKPPGERHLAPDLQRVVDAPDARELLDWLRQRPLLHHDRKLDFAMVHAGLAPQWDIEQAKRCARQVEKVLRSDSYRQLFSHMYGNKPNAWDESLENWDRLRVIVNVFTRQRFCDARGTIAFGQKGPPGSQAEGYYPWYEVPGHKPRGTRIVFGHWSALGRFQGLGVFGVDTGCVWGGELTALRLCRHPRFHCVPAKADGKGPRPGRFVHPLWARPELATPQDQPV